MCINSPLSFYSNIENYDGKQSISYNPANKSISITVNEQLFKKIVWLLNSFKNDGLEYQKKIRDEW